MVFPHQIDLLNQFYITLPAACLLSITIDANAEYRRGFQLNSGEVKADILRGALIWLPCWGLMKLLDWVWGGGWLTITVFYLFYGLLVIIASKAIKRAFVYHNTLEEGMYWCKNLLRPSWDKQPCPFKGRGMAGIGKDYAEDKARREKVYQRNKAAVDRIVGEPALLKIVTRAADWEIREYALLKMKDPALIKQALTKGDYSQATLLKLAGADTLQKGIERAGSVELLLQILRHCDEESDIEWAFAKLPQDFNFAAMVCETGYSETIRFQALNRCSDDATLRRVIISLNALDKNQFGEIKIKAAEKCNDLHIIREIIPQLIKDFSNKDLSRIIRKCSDQAIFKKIAGGDCFTSDINRIEAIGGISDQDFLLDLALKTKKEAVAKAALKKIAPETIENHWPRILAELDFDLLHSLLDKHNNCPDCGGKLITKSSSGTDKVGAPGDSFFRTTEWYEVTTTFSAIHCQGCQKTWRTDFRKD